jgi:hypothetical protein
MSGKLDKQYVNDLAKTVNDLFFNEITDPTAEQIATAYYGDKVIPQAVVDDVQRRLTRIRRALEEDGHQTCPLSQTYYRRFRRISPQTRDEARLCLALGRGRPQVGLLLLTGVDEGRDVIWQEWVSLQLNQAAGKVRKQSEAIGDAVERDKLTMTKAGEILSEAQRQSLPHTPIPSQIESGQS